MSSMKTTTNLSNSGMNTEFIKYVKWAGAFVNPKDITKYSNNPYSGGECGLGYILGSNLDLMIAQSEINFRKHSGSSELIE
jgi:hypothetical protein